MEQLYALQSGRIAYPPASVRVQTGVLARQEKRVLRWMCSHVPGQLTPDHLTFFGAIGAIMVFCGYVAGRAHPGFLWLAIAGYAINWFGDSLDGSLARHRGTERKRYGYFLDHSIDACSMFLVMIGLGLSGYVRFDIAMLVLVSYFLMCIHVFLANPVTGRFQLTFLSVGPTELRIGLIILTAMMYFHIGDKHIWGFSYLSLLLLLNALILIALFAINTFNTSHELYQTDQPAPGRAKSNGPDHRDFWLSMAKSQSLDKNLSMPSK